MSLLHGFCWFGDWAIYQKKQWSYHIGMCKIFEIHRSFYIISYIPAVIHQTLALFFPNLKSQKIPPSHPTVPYHPTHLVFWVVPKKSGSDPVTKYECRLCRVAEVVGSIPSTMTTTCQRVLTVKFSLVSLGGSFVSRWEVGMPTWEGFFRFQGKIQFKKC